MLISLHLRCYGRKHLKSRSTIFTALPSYIKTVISLEEAIGLVKYGSAFYKSTMTTPNDLPILYMLGNYFQDYYYVLSRDQDEADWPVVFWIFLFVLLEDRNVLPEFFLSRVLNLSWSPWPFKNDSECPQNNIVQLPQHSQVHPQSPKGFSM